MPESAPDDVAASIQLSIDEARGSRRIRLSDLRDLFGFQRWSAKRKAMVTARLAALGVEAVPPLSKVRRNSWVELVSNQATEYSAEMTALWDPEMVVLGMTVGSLVTAFCTELGKRMGESVADWARRVKWYRRKSHPHHIADIEVNVGDVVTTLEITDTLTDEAILALLDLDLNDFAVRGQSLRWDGEIGAWKAIESLLPPGQKVWWDGDTRSWRPVDRSFPRRYRGPILLWDDEAEGWISVHEPPPASYRGPIGLWNEARESWRSWYNLPRPRAEGLH
jgi:hypothetical protein